MTGMTKPFKMEFYSWRFQEFFYRVPREFN